MRNYPRPPAHIEPYVRILGPEMAFKFLMEFGGSEMSISKSTTMASPLVRCLGESLAEELRDYFGEGKRRIPVGREWLARILAEQGLSANKIAPLLHTTDVTVRRMLKASRAREHRDKMAKNQFKFPFVE